MIAPSVDAGAWNPEAAQSYMRQVAETDQQEMLDPTCEVRIFDKFCQLAEYAQDYLDLEFTFEKNGAGALSMKLPADAACRDHIFSNPDGADAIVPIVVTTSGTQWSGQIDTASIVLEDGVETIEITALHDWEWCNRVAMWPSPFAPLEAQFPKRMVGIGPAETIIKTFYKANLLRNQLPLWKIPALNELFKADAWFNLGNANFPVAVMPVNVLRDATKWCAVSARMQTGSELFEQVLKDSGLSLTARLFLPDEEEQPAPDHFIMDRPTVLLDVENHTGVTGLTGTAVDGVAWWVTELLDDLVTEVLSRNPEQNGDIIMDDDLGEISKWLGIKKARPDVIWMDGQYSSIISGEVVLHKPLARDIIIGGRSPGWVNGLVDLGITSLLAYVGTAVGASGLASLYSGQLDDILLAYQRFTDRGRAQRAGPYLYHEHVVADASTAYTVDGVMAGKSGIWDTRGYVSKSIKVRDGDPYVFGVDFDLGWLVGYELDGMIWTDYVQSATFRDSREERAFWDIQIGDGSAEESDGTKAHRKISALYSIAKDLAQDAGTDFGLGVI